MWRLASTGGGPRPRLAHVCGVVARFVPSASVARHKVSKKRYAPNPAVQNQFVMTGLCTSDTYNLKMLPSVVRQSDRYSLVNVHSDCCNHVVQVQETLPDGRQRNAFIFKFGAAVLWNTSTADAEDDVQMLMDVLLRPIARGVRLCDAHVFEELEQMDYTVSSATKSQIHGESLVLSRHDLDLQLADDEIAVSHALAMSVKLSIVEGQLEKCTAECRSLLTGKFQPVRKQEAWRRILQILDLDTQANHPPVEMDDFYWERVLQDSLHTEVLRVFDYNRRIAEFNRALVCCKQFVDCHYRHTVQAKDDLLTYLIIILILCSIALGQVE